MKKIGLVTGAEGFIGSHLVKFLLAKGWDVIGTYLLEPSDSSPESSNLCFTPCDLRNRAQVSEVVARYQPTHIFHLGAQSLPTLSWSDPVTTFESNIMGSLYLFEAIRRMKRPPVVVSACLEQAEYGERSGFGHSGYGRAAAPAVASVRHQQSLPGPSGARILPGL